MENYEDPVHSKPNNISNTHPAPVFVTAPSLPQGDVAPEEAEYADTTVAVPSGAERESVTEASTDWNTVYTKPPREGQVKVSSLKDVKMKGLLEKLGGKNRKAWQKRYCVLAGALMYFYEKESSKTFNNCIVVASFKASMAPNITIEKKKQFGFKLTHTDHSFGKPKDYYFRAMSADHRDKWLRCCMSASSTPRTLSPSPFMHAGATTLPRMPSHPSVSPILTPPGERRRAHSAGDEEDEGEMYEDMGAHKDEDSENSEDEYVAVNTDGEAISDRESSEEYVDVTPQANVEQGDGHMQPPPPPLIPPPGPPSEIFTPPLVQATPSHSECLGCIVDTSRVYINDNSCGIVLEQVYVSQWDFAAGEGDELGLRRGDLVHVSNPLHSLMWWYGELLDAEASRKVGRAGFFPKDYSSLAFEAMPS